MKFFRRRKHYVSPGVKIIIDNIDTDGIFKYRSATMGFRGYPFIAMLFCKNTYNS